MRYMIFDTAWGPFGMVTRGTRLAATYLPRPLPDLQRLIEDAWPDAVESRSLLPRFRKHVVSYFRGRYAQFDVELDLEDLPPFRQTVLAQCRRIPYGETRSYAQLARTAGNPKAVRAVGGAMAHNPLPLVIPCHRVLRADGSLGGFSSYQGTEAKARMLRLERDRVEGEAGARKPPAHGRQRRLERSSQAVS